MADFPSTVSANGAGVTLDANICDGTIVSAASNDSGVNYVYDYIDITPGATYAFTVDVTRLAGTTAMRLDVKWRKPDGSSLSVDQGPAGPSTVGARQTLTFTGQAPAGSGHAIVCVRYTATPSLSEKFRTSNPGLTLVSPPPATGRDALVLGVDKPTPATTGVLPGSTLTIVTDHVPVSGTTYENLDIRNSVNFGGKSNVTYRNCYFRGASAAPSSASSLARLFGTHGRGHVFIDCTFQPQVPHFRWNGIQGYGYTLRRCLFLDNTDHLQLFNNNDDSSGGNSLRNGPLDILVEQCYFGGNGWWPQSVDTGGGPIGSHSDQVQHQGGTAVTIRGNVFTGMIGQQYGPNSYGTYHDNTAFMIKPDVGNISGLLIEKNWIDGGSFSVNIANDAPDRVLGNIGSIKNNRFGRNQRIDGGGGDNTYTISMPSNVSGTFTGNVYDDTNTPIRVRTNG